MSVAGISSASTYLQAPQSTSTTSAGNNRRAEDAAARELITDLQQNNLAGAQQAYQTLASFGANGSGPWAAGSQQQAEFQQLGQDLSSGDLKGAKGDATTLAKNQMSNDLQSAQGDLQSGNVGAYNQAMQNYQGDYWAIFGSSQQGQGVVGGGATPPIIQGVNVTA